MRILILISLFAFACSEELKIDSYDNEGSFTIKNTEKTVSEIEFHISTLFYNDEILYKATTANGSVAVRYADTDKVFLSSAQDKNGKIIIIGSFNGGVKLVLRLNDKMQYEPMSSGSIKEFHHLIDPHFIKLPLSEK
jgi:hypothetical protein